MMYCNQELCPMWSGAGCPCRLFDLDRDNLPTDGTFTIALSSDDQDDPRTRANCDGRWDTWGGDGVGP